LWSRAVIVAIPALASFILDDLSSHVDPLFRHWHSVWHVLALVSTAYAMAFVLAVQLAQVNAQISFMCALTDISRLFCHVQFARCTHKAPPHERVKLLQGGTRRGVDVSFAYLMLPLCSLE
jgi:hypothetical protein